MSALGVIFVEACQPPLPAGSAQRHLRYVVGRRVNEISHYEFFPRR